jgi:hypothetical protein
VADTLSGAVTATVVIGGPLLFLMSPDVASGIIGVMQDLFYFQFFNVEYPGLVVTLLQMYSTGTYNFIPSPYDSIISDYNVESPKNFEKNGFSGLFLETGKGLILLYSIILLFLYLKTRVLTKVIKFDTLIKEDFSVKIIILEFVISSYPQLVYASVLQLRVPDFTNLVYIISYFLALSTMILCTALPFWLKRQLTNPKFDVLAFVYQKKKFILFEIGKKYLSACTMVAFYYYPLVQILASLVLNLGLTICFAVMRPLTTRFLFLIDLVIKIGFTLLVVLVLILGIAGSPPTGFEAYFFVIAISIFLARVVASLAGKLKRRPKKDSLAPKNYVNTKKISVTDKETKNPPPHILRPQRLRGLWMD